MKKQRETFVDGLTRLEKQHQKSKLVTAKPDALALDDIKTAPSVFQPRLFYGGREVDEHHVKNLARSLSANGSKVALERILVMRIGKQAFCIDGHHRLAAYKSAGWTSEVPVAWFEGSIREGAQEAVRLNSRDKLPMTRVAKWEAAWRLVVLGELSKSEINELTTVPLSTVGNMRKRLRELEEEYAATPAEVDEFTGEAIKEPFGCRLTWAEAKDRRRGEIGRDTDWEEKIIAEWVEKLAKAFGREWGRQPRLAAQAIARYSEDLPSRIVEVWLLDGVVEVDEALISEMGQ